MVQTVTPVEDQAMKEMGLVQSVMVVELVVMVAALAVVTLVVPMMARQYPFSRLAKQTDPIFLFSLNLIYLEFF
jgi:uncharacterized membrane protein YqjE